jgi:hypothetical protein
MMPSTRAITLKIASHRFPNFIILLPFKHSKMIKHKPTLKVHFIDISDPHIQRKLLHKLSDIFFITLCAVICGGDNWVVIEKPYCQFFTLPGLTATQGLFNIGKHKKDETIIVTGAAGSIVGQLAKADGLKLFGVAKDIPTLRVTLNKSEQSKR